MSGRVVQKGPSCWVWDKDAAPDQGDRIAQLQRSNQAVLLENRKLRKKLEVTLRHGVGLGLLGLLGVTFR